MFGQTTIPPPDPMPLPAPVWLLQFLLILTLVLHITAMNLSLGGGFLSALSFALGRSLRNVNHQALARGISAVIPYAIAATITLGIAPLLFIQVIYGQFIYTSSILIAIFWLLVIPLLILSYYGFYYFNFRTRDWRKVNIWVVWLTVLAFLIIAFIYTNNMTLMLTPEKWRAMYFKNPYGFWLNLTEPSLIPRFLHFFIASLAVGGILITYYGLFKTPRDAKLGKWAIRYGVKWFTLATVAQMADGIWFLFSLPANIRAKFLGEDAGATAHLIAGAFLALLAIAVFHAFAYRKNPTPGIIIGSGLVLLTIVLMVLMRDIVRRESLEPYWAEAGLPQGLGSLPVHPQWGVFFVFAVLLILAIATLGWMIVKVLKPAQ